MATKRRHVPAAVKQHLDRRRKQTASLAVRQGAGLGKSARDRLKPLIDDVPDVDDNPFDLTVAWKDMSRQLITSFKSNWIMPSGNILIGGGTGFTFMPITYPPAIDADKLEALKGAAARKVTVQVPDMVHVITGWRGWTLRNGRLGALGIDSQWPTRQALEAECKKSIGFSSSGEHLAPEWSCTCGIWAFKDVDRLVAAIGGQYPAVKVIGSVSLWGKVIETENGYRAQYAYPSELWLLDNALEDLGRVYDVPIRTA